MGIERQRIADGSRYIHYITDSSDFAMNALPPVNGDTAVSGIL
ncbi:hypothetical protein [Dyadobacter crusticola]|nr:hypothetical protein [Dyadobacter crusticola]